MFGCKLRAGVAVLVILGGCGPTEENTTRGATDGMNVAFAPDAPIEGLRGLQPVRIRTVVMDPARPTLESKPVDALCRLQGQDFVAQFTAPAVVNVPNYGPDTAPFELSCRYQGKDVSKTVRPVNFSESKRISKRSNVAAGLVLFNPGMVVGGLTSRVTTNQDGSDIFGYNDVQLVLNQ